MLLVIDATGSSDIAQKKLFSVKHGEHVTKMWILLAVMAKQISSSFVIGHPNGFFSSQTTIPLKSLWQSNVLG